jgi:hypothetical protein
VNTIHGNVTGRKVTAVDPEELIEAVEAARLLHQKPQTLATWRCDNKGPEYLKVGRAILYRREAICAWLARQVVEPAA